MPHLFQTFEPLTVKLDDNNYAFKPLKLRREDCISVANGEVPTSPFSCHTVCKLYCSNNESFFCRSFSKVHPYVKFARAQNMLCLILEFVVWYKWSQQNKYLAWGFLPIDKAVRKTIFWQKIDKNTWIYFNFFKSYIYHHYFDDYIYHHLAMIFWHL